MSFNNISFILHQPQLSENIGACARAIKNFNFKKYKPELICIELVDTFNPNNKIIKKNKIYKFLVNKKYRLVWSGHFSHIFKAM